MGDGPLKKRAYRKRTGSAVAELGDPPYICQFPDCGRSFSTVRAFKDHTGPPHGIRSFACPFPGCGSTYEMRNGLQTHIRNKHPNLAPGRPDDYASRMSDAEYALRGGPVTLQSTNPMMGDEFEEVQEIPPGPSVGHVLRYRNMLEGRSPLVYIDSSPVSWTHQESRQPVLYYGRGVDARGDIQQCWILRSRKDNTYVYAPQSHRWAVEYRVACLEASDDPEAKDLAKNLVIWLGDNRLQLRHRCGTKGCIRYEHGIFGTASDNLTDDHFHHVLRDVALHSAPAFKQARASLWASPKNKPLWVTVDPTIDF